MIGKRICFNMYYNNGFFFKNKHYTDSFLCEQSLIAESIDDQDTLDLFRHTTQLGYHPESGSGYAQLVLQTMQNDVPKQFYLYNIVSLNAVTVASDAMTWYTGMYNDFINSFFFNLLF